MKKLLLITLACCMLPLIAKHDLNMDMSQQDISTLVKGLKDVTITEPASLAKEWLTLHADKLKLGAEEAQAMADQFSGEDKAKWERVIALKKELEAALRSLPVKDFKKSFEHFGQWMKLKKQMYAIKAKQLAVVAEQVANPEVKKLLENKSTHFAHHVSKLASALMS